MGTFAGHVLPGSFFLFFGLWWSFITAIRYIQSRNKSSHKKDHQYKYKATVIMPCICCPCFSLRRAPVESILKLVFTTIGIIGELATGIHYRQVPKHRTMAMPMSDGPMQHVHHRDLDHLEHTNANSTRAAQLEMKEELWLIPGGLAFSVEAYLFAFHLHGKDPLEIHIHTLLVYTILGCVFCGIFEMIFTNEILFTYGRILFTILQGTWFIEIAFVLYPPFEGDEWKWDPNEMNQLMLITLSYAWHIFFILFGFIFQIWITKRFYLKSKNISKKFDELVEIDNHLASHEFFFEINDNQSTKFLRLLSDEESEGEKLIYDSIKMEQQDQFILNSNNNLDNKTSSF